MGDEDIIMPKVMWVDDDLNLVQDYCIAAERQGLDLVHFPNWTDAKKELHSNYDNYEAIILDARCRIYADTTENPDAIKFLGYVLGDLRLLAQERNRVMPWYILSAGEAERITGIKELVEPYERHWDRDMEGYYYRKETNDRNVLFGRIREYCNNNPSKVMEVKSIAFPDVFAAIRRTFSGKETCVLSNKDSNEQEELTPDKMEGYMMDLLMPFVDNSTSAVDCNRNFILARKVLNYIYEHMYKMGDFPQMVYSSQGVNLNWCSLILQGEESQIRPQENCMNI